MTDAMVTTEQTLAQNAGEAAEELAWASLEIQKAQRQITRGMSELAEGIVSLSLVLLDVRRRRLYRSDPEYPTFEAFVEQRHGISAQTAHHYVEALSSLGEAQYRTLISDLGVQRTYALAMLQKTDPALVVAFQALPAEERRAVTVAQIEAVDDAATAELQARVSQLEQEITRERGLHQQSRKRLQEAEELHQRVASDLIEERDEARQALDQEQTQTERLRKLLAEAKRQPAALASLRVQPVQSTPALPASAQADRQAVTEGDIITSPNMAELLLEARTLAQKLEQLKQIPTHDIPGEQRRMLAVALVDLQQTLQEVLNGA